MPSPWRRRAVAVRGEGDTSRSRSPTTAPASRRPTRASARALLPRSSLAQPRDRRLRPRPRYARRPPQAHGGRLSWRTAPEGGLLARLLLPADQAERAASAGGAAGRKAAHLPLAAPQFHRLRAAMDLGQTRGLDVIDASISSKPTNCRPVRPADRAVISHLCPRLARLVPGEHLMRTIGAGTT